MQEYGKLPLSFEENAGQAEAPVRFLSRGNGYILLLSDTEAVLSLQRTAEGKDEAPVSDAVQVQLVGSNSDPAVNGQDRLPGESNYLIGNDPTQWRTGIAQYGKVAYRDVYPGIDLVYYGTDQRQLEHDFVVAPGADPAQIRFSVAGTEQLRLDETGDLLVSTSGGDLVFQAPVTYQEIEGQRRPVESHYVLEAASGNLADTGSGSPVVGFELGGYDPAHPLVIDPVLSYSTYLGSGTTDGYGIAVDGAGQAYLAGQAGTIPILSTPPAYQPTSHGGYWDACVVVLNSAGTAVLASTYLGGFGGSDYGIDIALDGAGQIYLTGYTNSVDFPVTSGAFQPSYVGGGLEDAFVSVLNSSGASLDYSTYLGGSARDVGTGIALNGTDLFVVGWTISPNFPTTAGSYQPAYGGGENAFVAKVIGVGAVTVSVPTVTATYNEVLTIPVSISNASGIVAAEVFVEYDTALLTVFSAPSSPTSSTGTLSDGWSVQTNTEPGAGTLETLKITLATDQSSATGAQTLININFTVNDVRVPASSPLSLTHVLLNNGDPANVAVDGSVTLVGNDGSIDSSPAQIIPRQDITVTVVDPDADLDGSGLTDQVTVTATNGLQTETLTLDETATPGEFVGTIGSVFSLASTAAAGSGDDILQAKAGDQIAFSFSDELDASGAGPIVRLDQTDVVGGTDGTVEISIASQPGDDVYIKVVDADISNPPLGYIPAATSIDVDVVNSTTSATVPVTLTETVPASGIFVGTLATTPGVEAGKMTSAEDDLLTVTYVDDLAADGAPQVDRTDDNQVLDPWGDADDNEQLQAYDAALTLLEVLFPTTLNGLEELAANVDIDPVGTGITPYDAALILQYRVGFITSFPVQAAASTNNPQPNPASPKVTPQERSLALRAGDGYLSVWAEERDQIVSGDLLLEGVDGRTAMGDGLGDFLLASRPTDEGLRIVFAGAAAVSGPGELLRVYGADLDGARLTRAAFNNGSIEGTGMGLVASESQPLSTALHGNWPNPFNPETSIRFDLAQAGAVRLEVFDALGQKVKTLVAEELPAGAHQVVWRGVDERGMAVSSGMYLYRLQAGDYTQMRRMLLLK